MTDFPAPIRHSDWMLDPEITYLNHGSFGARPKEVFEAQQKYKREFEESPVHFLDRQKHRLKEARTVTAAFIGCDEDGFGFVENATTGIGCVMKSLQLEQGSEILTTNHVYNGIRQLLTHHASVNDLQYREIEIHLPVLSETDIIESISNALTSTTTLLVIDHVTSSTAIVFPIKQIVQLCKEKGVLVLVDGAHAPGMLDLNVNELDADWYVGNFHKWVCAPLGAAFVWSNQNHRDQTRPMTISHFLEQGYTSEFDWQGTRDISAWLAVQDAIAWGVQIGWDVIRAHNHQLATWMQLELTSKWGVEPLSPLDGRLLGSMVTVTLPSYFPQTTEECLQWRDALYNNDGIESNIFEFEGKGMIRLSAQLYVQKQDVAHLVAKLDI